MPLSMFEVAVPTFRQSLPALRAVLDKAEMHCDARFIDHGAILTARIFPDMQPFTFQVMNTVNHSACAVYRLMDREIDPKFLPDRLTSALESFAVLKQTLDDAIAILEQIQPGDLDGTENREVTITRTIWKSVPGMARGTVKFSGGNYLLSFALPNFFFHVTTAYNILRNSGIELSKRDFLGVVRKHSIVPEGTVERSA